MSDTATQDTSETSKQLRLKDIDQLHSTLIEFNKNSIELKKLCTGLITTMTIVLCKIDSNTLKWEYLAIVIMMSLTFWAVDAYYYYSQRNIRSKMIKLKNKLVPNYEKQITNNRFDAIFNYSNAIYFFFIIASIILIVCMNIK